MMVVHDQAKELEENLPLYLNQEYEHGYEVIIIDDTSTDDTTDVLKRLKGDYKHLYTTFLPKPNRLFVHKKNALNIGIKAAKKDWIIITKINKKFEATDVLQTIAESMDDCAELTLGYMGKKGIRLQSFADCQDAKDHIRKSERRLKNVRERRRMGYVCGRYDFIIIQKEHAHKILNYYEEKISAWSLLGIRLRIIFKNLF